MPPLTGPSRSLIHALASSVLAAAVAVVLAACGDGSGAPPSVSASPVRDTIALQLQLPAKVRRAREDSLAALYRDSAAQSRSDSLRRATPGYVIDSARSLAAQLQRFRATLPEVRGFTGGAPSRDSLVALVIAAVTRHDASALAALTVTRAEYAWLVHPALPIARPPYNHPPQAAWMLLAAESRTGRSRLIERFRGTPLVARGLACDGREVYGTVTFWPNCRVLLAGRDGEVRAQRLFGAVAAVGGRFKLLSFWNDF